MGFMQEDDDDCPIMKTYQRSFESLFFFFTFRVKKQKPGKVKSKAYRCDYTKNQNFIPSIFINKDGPPLYS